MPTCSIHCALSMCDIFGDAQLLTHALTNLRISGGPWVDFQLKLVQNKNLFRQRHQDQPYHSLKVYLITQKSITTQPSFYCAFYFSHPNPIFTFSTMYTKMFMNHSKLLHLLIAINQRLMNVDPFNLLTARFLNFSD